MTLEAESYRRQEADELQRERIAAIESDYGRVLAGRDALLETCKATRRALSDLNGRVSREVWISLFDVVEMLDKAVSEAER